ncbi:MAG: undecaprenyl-diphosphate phosphatase [Planctomycetota bacterium]
MGLVLEAVLLGLLQGLTEFLPISSSGHVAIGMQLLGWDPGGNLGFLVAVHLGSLGAVLVFSFREIRAMLTTQPRLLLVVIVATVPLAVVGLLAKELVEELSRNLYAVGAFLLLTAGLLAFARTRDRGAGTSARLSVGRAFFVGLAQALAILPGVSRSGSTLAAGLTVGLEREQAVRFAFLLAAPAIAGAGLLLALKGEWGEGIPLAATLSGTVVSFVASLVAMKVMVAVVARRRLGWFACYCAAVGLFAIGYAFTLTR